MERERASEAHQRKRAAREAAEDELDALLDDQRELVSALSAERSRADSAEARESFAREELSQLVRKGENVRKSRYNGVSEKYRCFFLCVCVCVCDFKCFASLSIVG